jgi:hypothetical protein
VSDVNQGSKEEMSVREWLIRTVCALLAFGTAILALGGIVISGLEVEISSVANLNYGGDVCIGLAALSAFFGLSPMAQWLNRGLLHSLTGLEPLPPKR